MKSILRLNKNMQCGISYPSVVSGQTSDDWATLLAPVPRDTLPRLLLAGEHTSRTHGRVVHGARDTGVSQAQAIVKWTADNAGSDTVPGTTDMTTWGVS